MLEAVGLAKRFGDVVALRHSDLTATPGRIVGFLGPNGAGKTTTMRAVFGLVQPDAGQVTWQGAPIDAASRLRFGYLPEERGLYPRMPIQKQLTYFARLHGLDRASAEQRAAGWLDRLGLSDRAGDRVDQLSHGNQQRVQLAAALLHEPELLVLDEPFVGLDPMGVDRMVEVLREVAANGAAVVFSSHQLDLVEHLCDDVIIVAGGRTVLRGSLEEVRGAARVRTIRVRPERPDDFVPPAGTTVARRDGDDLVVEVPPDLGPGAVLRAAEAAGGVRVFVFEPPTLAEVFRQVVGRSVQEAEAEAEAADAGHVPPAATGDGGPRDAQQEGTA